MNETAAKVRDATPRKYAVKRTAIVIAACRVLNAQGTRGFTLAAVARLMDMHPVSLTYYFKTREELAVECLMATISHWETVIAEARLAPTPETRVAALVAGHFEIRRQAAVGLAPEFCSFSEMKVIDVAPDAPVVDAFSRMLGKVEDMLCLELDPLTRGLQARLILEHLGWARSWIHLYEPEEYAGVAGRLTDIILNGLAGPDQIWSGVAGFTVGATPREGVSREQFLIAAIDLFNYCGYGGASVDQIAGRLNVTKGSFYHHNSDKEELLAACFDRTFALFREAQVKARAQGGSGWTRLSSAAVALITGHQEGGGGRLLRNYAIAALSPERRPSVIGRFQDIAVRLAGMISDGIADGSIRPVDPMLAAQVVIGVVNASAPRLRRHDWLEELDPAQAFGRPGLMGFSA